MIIKKMINDLNIPVKISVMPTVREKDGLAMSSRNAYLSSKERQEARLLSASLRLAERLVQGGVRDARIVTAAMRTLILTKKNLRIEYICVVNTQDLRPLRKITPSALIALAVRVGKTRLIDNIVFSNL